MCESKRERESERGVWGREEKEREEREEKELKYSQVWANANF